MSYFKQIWETDHPLRKEMGTAHDKKLAPGKVRSVTLLSQCFKRLEDDLYLILQIADLVTA